MKSIPLISADEVDALMGPARKRAAFRAGVRKSVKRQVSRRSRAKARQALRRGGE